MKKTLLYIFILFQSIVVNAQNDTILYSFFSAGHTYGSPNDHHYGLHYPFVDFIPEINNYHGMEIDSEKIQKKSVTKIDVGDLTPGIYFLQFYDRTRNVTKKIIVK